MSLSVSCDTGRIYPTDRWHRRPAPASEPPREPVIDRVVKDVLEGRLILLFGLDYFRPEALAEDVVLSAMPLVEGACVLAVEVAHAVGEVRERRLDQQVVVVAEQAAGVQSPVVPTPNAVQDLDEDGSIAVVEEDRRLVVALGADVVVGAGCEVAVGSSHLGDRSRGERRKSAARVSRHKSVTDPSRAGHETGRERPCPPAERDVAC